MTLDVHKWRWSLAEIYRQDDGGLEYLFRWRQLPKDLVRSDWPCTLVITWENRFSTPEGFPVEREWDLMGEFDLRLGEAVEHDALALMTLCLTGNREWKLVFHTRDVDEFSKRLHEMPQEEQRYPIQIEKHDDPSWKYLDESFARFGVDPAQKLSLWQRIKNLFD